MLRQEEPKIGDILADHEDHLVAVSKALENQDAGAFVTVCIELVATVATGIPGLGTLFSAAGKRAFAESAYNKTNELLEQLDDELGQEERLQRIREITEVLLGQAVLQIVRSQHNVKEELMQQLGGLRQEFRDFREAFQANLEQADNYIEVDTQIVTEAARGIVVGSSSVNATIKIAKQKVSGRGSVGIELK